MTLAWVLMKRQIRLRSRETVSIPSLVPSAGLPALLGQYAVAFRPPVPEELPYFANFQDHVQVEVRHQHLILVTAGLGDDLAAGIAEITLAVELADAPGFLFANPVDGADEISVGHGVGRLL